MPFSSYFWSTVQLCLGAWVVWGVSVPLFWAVGGGVSRLTAALAVLGLQTSLLYLKPAGISVGWVILLPVLLAAALFRRKKIDQG